jgi:hypothetical protein
MTKLLSLFLAILTSQVAAVPIEVSDEQLSKRQLGLGALLGGGAAGLPKSMGDISKFMGEPEASK